MAILGVVTKEERGAPVWRARIAEAVAPFGRLAEIARRAEMSSPQLQKIANGTTKDPGVNTLERIARAIGITLVDLLSPLRPEGDPGRAAAGTENHPVLSNIILAGLDADTAAEDSWRGDVYKAITVLLRAVQRPAAGDLDTRAAKVGR